MPSSWIFITNCLQVSRLKFFSYCAVVGCCCYWWCCSRSLQIAFNIVHICAQYTIGRNAIHIIVIRTRHITFYLFLLKTEDEKEKEQKRDGTMLSFWLWLHNLPTSFLCTRSRWPSLLSYSMYMNLYLLVCSEHSGYRISLCHNFHLFGLRFWTLQILHIQCGLEKVFCRHDETF